MGLSSHSDHLLILYVHVRLSLSWVCPALQLMESSHGGGKPKISPQYVRFFEILGFTDAVKVQTLAHYLHTFYEMATHLDAHLLPVGASLPARVGCVIEPEDPRAAPQHRWIRVFDRLGFFTNNCAHAARVVSVGMSFAYRHNELNLLTAASTLRLGELDRSVPSIGAIAATSAAARANWWLAGAQASELHRRTSTWW